MLPTNDQLNHSAANAFRIASDDPDQASPSEHPLFQQALVYAALIYPNGDVDNATLNRAIQAIEKLFAEVGSERSGKASAMGWELLQNRLLFLATQNAGDPSTCNQYVNAASKASGEIDRALKRAEKAKPRVDYSSSYKTRLDLINSSLIDP